MQRVGLVAVPQSPIEADLPYLGVGSQKIEDWLAAVRVPSICEEVIVLLRLLTSLSALHAHEAGSTVTMCDRILTSTCILNRPVLEDEVNWLYTVAYSG